MDASHLLRGGGAGGGGEEVGWRGDGEVMSHFQNTPDSCKN